MFPFPPPLQPLQQKAASLQQPTTTPAGQHRPASALSSASSADSGCSPGQGQTPERLLPSLLSAAPFLGAPPGHVFPVQGLQLNQLLHQTAHLMAANERLRKEIEQVRGIKGADAPLPAFFLAPDTGGPLAPFQQNNARLPPPGRKSPLPDSYKTVMCQAWLEAATCSFGENCRFAHGEHELRPGQQPTRQNRKYKTKLCDKYTNTGLCPYGTRCLFIHPDIGNNAYIRPDKLEELRRKQEERKKMEETGGTEEQATHAVVGPQKSLASIGSTPTSRPRQSLRPHPSWPLEPSSFFIGGPLGGMEVPSFFSMATGQPLAKRPATPDVARNEVAALLAQTPHPPNDASSGYLSDASGRTPPSGCSSGSASPTDAVGSSRPSTSSPDDAYGGSPPSPLRLYPSLALPPLSVSGWSDPFAAALDIDNIAREMAKEIGM